MSNDVHPALALGNIGITGFDTLPSIHVEKNFLTFGRERIALPDSKLDVAEAIRTEKIGDWNSVVDWLARLIMPGQTLFVAGNHQLRDLAAIGAARGLFSYALSFPTAPAKIFTRDYDLISNARFCVFPDADVESDFRRVYVSPYIGAQAKNGIDGLLKAECISHNRKNRNLLSADPVRVRVLILAYFSGTARTVGVQRINYWQSIIPCLAPDISVTVATSMQNIDTEYDTRFIADRGAAGLISADGSVPDWGRNFVDSERRNAKSFSTLSHYWRYSLEKYFESSGDHFDVVVISGNPFPVFDFSAFAKRRWNARVILDYRDPFANNPRMAYTPDARYWARYIEKGYNLQADLITVVNSACADMVEGAEDVDVLVVPNGFDDTGLSLSEARWHEDDGRIHFVHAGSFYAKCPPEYLIGSLDSSIHRFHHFGNPTSLEAMCQNGAIKLYGSRPYAEVMQKISQADCGIVFMSGDDFETPTKLYDYLAHGLDVLIISAGSPNSGPVAEILDGVDGVWWCRNTYEDLSIFLNDYRPSLQRRSTNLTERFSRRHGTKILIDAIRRLSSGADA